MNKKFILKSLLALTILGNATFSFANISDDLVLISQTADSTTYAPAEGVDKATYLAELEKAKEVETYVDYGIRLRGSEAVEYKDGYFVSEFKTTVDVKTPAAGTSRSLKISGTSEERWTGNTPSAYCSKIKALDRFTVSGKDITQGWPWALISKTSADYTIDYDAAETKFSVIHNYNKNSEISARALNNIAQTHEAMFYFGANSHFVDSYDKTNLW